MFILDTEQIERLMYYELRRKFEPHQCPNNQGRGELIVALTADEKDVVLQFQNPDWFMHFTPDQARGLARLLLKKADDIDPPSGN